MERERMFPMHLIAASGHLRSRGYDCRPAMLELLVKDGIVKPVGPEAWSQADVDVSAEHFEQCQLFVPYGSISVMYVTASAMVAAWILFALIVRLTPDPGERGLARGRTSPAV